MVAGEDGRGDRSVETKRNSNPRERRMAIARLSENCAYTRKIIRGLCGRSTATAPERVSFLRIFLHPAGQGWERAMRFQRRSNLG